MKISRGSFSFPAMLRGLAFIQGLQSRRTPRRSRPALSFEVKHE